MKNALIVLWAVALVLGIITFFVVFEPTGTHAPAASLPRSASPISATSTSTSTTTATSTGALPPTGDFASEYSPPYLLNWNEGRETFSITAASLVDNRLALVLAIRMGDARECVPLGLRLVADEAGTLRAPALPPNAVFNFPDTQSCTGSAGATYSQSVVFDVGGAAGPFLMTTGGTANTFFQVATTSPNGVQIVLPSQSG